MHRLYIYIYIIPELIYLTYYDIQKGIMTLDQVKNNKNAFLPVIVISILEVIWSRTPMFSRNVALCICICAMTWCHAILRMFQ